MPKIISTLDSLQIFTKIMLFKFFSSLSLFTFSLNKNSPIDCDTQQLKKNITIAKCMMMNVSTHSK